MTGWEQLCRVERLCLSGGWEACTWKMQWTHRSVLCVMCSCYVLGREAGGIKTMAYLRDKNSTLTSSNAFTCSYSVFLEFQWCHIKPSLVRAVCSSLKTSASSLSHIHTLSHPGHKLTCIYNVHKHTHTCTNIYRDSTKVWLGELVLPLPLISIYALTWTHSQAQHCTPKTPCHENSGVSTVLSFNQ